MQMQGPEGPFNRQEGIPRHSLKSVGLVWSWKLEEVINGNRWEGRVLGLEPL